jgi:hypothetical protein
VQCEADRPPLRIDHCEWMRHTFLSGADQWQATARCHRPTARMRRDSLSPVSAFHSVPKKRGPKRKGAATIAAAAASFDSG